MNVCLKFTLRTIPTIHRGPAGKCQLEPNDDNDVDADENDGEICTKDKRVIGLLWEKERKASQNLLQEKEGRTRVDF